MNVKPVSCELLTAYLLGELSDGEMSNFEQHMQSCSVCRYEFLELQSVQDRLTTSAEENENIVLRPDLKSLTLGKAFSTRPPKTKPWYNRIKSTRKVSTLQMLSTVAAMFVVGLVVGREYTLYSMRSITSEPMYMLNQVTLQSSNTISGAQGVVMVYKSGATSKLVVYVQNLKPLADQYSCYTLWASDNNTLRNIGDFTVTGSGAAVVPINNMNGVDPNSLTITLEPSWNDPKPVGPIVLKSNVSRT